MHLIIHLLLLKGTVLHVILKNNFTYYGHKCYFETGDICNSLFHAFYFYGFIYEKQILLSFFLGLDLTHSIFPELSFFPSQSYHMFKNVIFPN